MPTSGSILVVDNEPTIVDLLLEVLTDAGYVAYAVEGAHTLAAIAAHLPALVLLDMHLPGVSSAWLVAQIRTGSSARLPIVLMTTTSHDAAPLLSAGAIECLDKPFDIDDLLVCVGRYVQPYQVMDLTCPQS
jgi:CheY-like chemotaxis protein